MHAHDLRIGARVRQRRLELGVSQKALALELKLTFQQIQKYENGLNRISASTLIELARALKTPAAWFLDEIAAPLASGPASLLHSFDGGAETRDRLITVIDGLTMLVRDLVSESLTEVQLDFANAAFADLPIAIYLIDREGRVIYYNTEAARFAGREPLIGQDMWCVTWRLWERNGRRLPHERCPMALAMKEDRVIRGATAIAERPDGSRALFAPFPTPLHDSCGALVGGFNALTPLAA